MKRFSEAVKRLREFESCPVRNQVWYFLNTPDDLAQLGRLRGLEPPCDPLNDPYISYTVGDTFAPVPISYVVSLEAAINAELPREYRLILSKFGAIHLPGEKALAFIDPSTICTHMKAFGPGPQQAPVIPIAYYDTDPNPLGLVRSGGRFLSQVYSLDVHWHSVQASASPKAESVTALIVELLANQ